MSVLGKVRGKENKVARQAIKLMVADRVNVFREYRAEKNNDCEIFTPRPPPTIPFTAGLRQLVRQQQVVKTWQSGADKIQMDPILLIGTKPFSGPVFNLNKQKKLSA